MASQNYHSQQGSIFVYILIAIALLAALTYAVSRGNRASTGALTQEQAKLAAQEIIEYGNAVATAVQKLRLRGCGEIQISFENPKTTFDYTNSNSPPDKTCHVYSNLGGNINTAELPAGYLEDARKHFMYTARNSFVGFGSDCLTSECADLAIHILPKENICLEINKTLGINFIPQDTDIYGKPSIGTWGDLSNQQLVLDEPSDNPLQGKAYGCFYEFGDGSPSHVFYQVLIAR